MDQMVMVIREPQSMNQAAPMRLRAAGADVWLGW